MFEWIPTGADSIHGLPLIRVPTDFISENPIILTEQKMCLLTKI